VRIVLADDSVLLREGLASLLTECGHEVVGRCGDAETLLALVGEFEPEVVVADIRMPPHHRDEGVRAAVAIRQRHPGIGVMLLSQHVEPRVGPELVSAAAGFGYLLKDRILDVEDFLDALVRVGRGGSALDPVVVGALLRDGRRGSPLERLSERERSVLELMAQGLSNAAIAGRLWVTERTVESHVGAVFDKLGLVAVSGENRRVRAVITYLEHAGELDPE
jgi:DNA-binding NarL/FixJ family response regulator